MSLAFAPTVEASAKTTLRVLHDHILILPDRDPKRLIWIPSDAYKRYRTGAIVSMGKGMKVNGRGTVRYRRNVYTWKGGTDELGYNRWPMPRVSVGDRVLYLVWSTTIILLDGAEHHIVRDTAIELVFEKEEKKNG